MKKFKKIFLIIAVICFFVLFVSPRPSSAFAEGGETISTAYNITQQYFTYMQANQQAILSQFYTYAYVSVVYRGVTRNYCCNVINIQTFSNRTVYTCGSGTCYYSDSALPVFSNQTITVYSDFIRVSGLDFYYDSSQHPTNYVIYCDLPAESYSNPNDSISLQSHTLNVVPPVSFGYISHQSGNYDNNIQDTLDRWQPSEPATLPPFNPPSTSPPATLPPDVLTICPPDTDINGSYIVDYQPYIYGDFYPVTTVQDDTILTSSGSLISYSWNFLTSYDDIKSIVLLLLILSLILNLLT